MITKTAMITICGRPNVGKSTLTNALLGEKIAIVSNKPQTTRNRISAVVNRGDAQLILMDTPGFHKPRNRLGDYMVQVVRESVADVDGVMLVVEPIASVGEQERALIERIRSTGAPAVLVINKIDTVEKQELLAVIAAYSEALPWRAIVPVSAQNGDGLDELLNELTALAVPGPQLFPDDMISDMPEKQICAELVREKLLLCLDKEIPHGTAVEVTKFSERDNGIIDMDVTIYCEKDEPQGHHHRQARRDAQEDRRACAAGHRALHGHEGVPADMGQGQGKLARFRCAAAQLRLHRPVRHGNYQL